ncbi:MAG: hypothetical protein A2284_02275 [Deltaproteobacteria bacterium RIFOXYA12_FULL_61_11]|nr:MAG: hypothetical protein A2284_02275 [Deltaproteobacteria bacterium RIFOXYA12_FULL_61_11]
MENDKTRDIRRREQLARVEEQFGQGFTNELLLHLACLEKACDDGMAFEEALRELLDFIGEKVPHVKDRFHLLAKEAGTPLERLKILTFIIKSLKSDVI